MLIHVEGPTPALLDDAKQIIHLLHTCYPGHPWSVRCEKGFVFIRHLDFPKNWGMGLRVSEVDHDAAVFKKKITMLAGEWLERACMRRGRHDAEQEIGRVEGVPEKEQPVAVRAPAEMRPMEAELRDTPRPQANNG